MMTLITGMPGAGKTAALVDLLSKLPGDRPIYVHYDPAAKRRPDQSVLHESLKIDHQPIHANDWPASLPDDAILVIDEVQDVWRPRGSTAKVPDAIAALEVHRHAGIDVYMTTQAPRLVDANVRGLVGRHVHIRDTGWLGRHWYEWPECNDSMTWKSCPVKKSYKLPKKAFDLYGSAVSHHKPVRTTPAALYWTIGAIIFALVLAAFALRIFMRPAAVDTSPVVKSSITTAHLVNSVSVASSVDTSYGPIDDRVAFIPRVSNKPESAPAYDQLRVITVMPVVDGGLCMRGVCKCYTSQGTDTGLSSAECKAFIENRPFDPYRSPDSAKVQLGATPSQKFTGGNVPDTVSPDQHSNLIPSPDADVLAFMHKPKQSRVP